MTVHFEDFQDFWNASAIYFVAKKGDERQEILNYVHTLVSMIIHHLNMEKRDEKEKALKFKHRLLVIDCPFSFGYISLTSGFIPTETEDPVIYTAPLTLSRLGTAVLLPVLFQLRKWYRCSSSNNRTVYQTRPFPRVWWYYQVKLSSPQFCYCKRWSLACYGVWCRICPIQCQRCSE